MPLIAFSHPLSSINFSLILSNFSIIFFQDLATIFEFFHDVLHALMVLLLHAGNSRASFLTSLLRLPQSLKTEKLAISVVVYEINFVIRRQSNDTVIESFELNNYFLLLKHLKHHDSCHIFHECYQFQSSNAPSFLYYIRQETNNNSLFVFQFLFRSILTCCYNFYLFLISILSSLMCSVNIYIFVCSTNESISMTIVPAS